MPYRMPTYKVLELLQVDPECGVRAQAFSERSVQLGDTYFEIEHMASVLSVR